MAKLFNLRRLQAKTKVLTDIIRSWFFYLLMTAPLVSEADIQRSINRFFTCANFGCTRHQDKED